MDARDLSSSMMGDVAIAAIPSEEGVAKSSAILTLLRDYLHDGAVQRGLIPDAVVRAPVGKVEATTSPEFMDRICLALCDMNHRVADEEKPGKTRPANVFERIKRAGCPAEVYLGMVQNPEFLRLLSRRATELIVMSQLPQIISALTVKSAHGDDKAARLVVEFLHILEVQDQDEIRLQYSRMDEDAMIRLMETEARRTLEYIAQHRGDDLEIEAVRPDVVETKQADLVIDLKPEDFGKC